MGPGIGPLACYVDPRTRGRGSDLADRIAQLSQLMKNPDPKVRLYALDEYIRNSHRVTEAELAKLLETASIDEDKAISLRASEGLAILGQRGFKQLRRVRNRRGGAGLGPTGSWEEDGTTREAAYKVLDEVIESLADLSGDMAYSRASAALEALGILRYPPSLGPMFKALARRETAQAAAAAIGRYPEDAALPLFRKLLEAPSFPEAPTVAMQGLGALAGKDSFALLEANVESPQEPTREAVAKALGERAEDAAEALLIKLSKDSSPRVVVAAIGSLGLVGEGPAASRLHELFINSGDTRVQAAILTSLGLIHRTESVEVIAKGLRSQDGRVRANAIEALAGFNLRAPEALRYFQPSLKDENNRAAANAILAIYPFDKDQATAVLQKLLKSKEALKRASAAYIIGEIQDPQLLQGLITMINTEQDKNVLSSALSSIDRIRNPEMKQGIAKLCQHPNDLIRGRAIQIFAGMSGLSELKILDTYFKKETAPTVRATIVSAFGFVCDMGHLAFLKTKLRDPDDRIVANAIEALDRVGALENIELIEPMTSHKSSRVRANALAALWHQGNLRSVEKLSEMLASSDEDVLASALHAAKDFAGALTPAGLKRHPLLRSALQQAYERMSSVGVTAWDMFRSSRFYQDVILGGPDAAAPLAAGPVTIEDSEPASPGTVLEPAAVMKPGPLAVEGESPGELALAAGVRALIEGRGVEALAAFTSVEGPDPVAALLAYLARRSARETGAVPPALEPAEPEDAVPFLPLHAARIDEARAANDLGGSLWGYFGLYRALVSLLGELIVLGENCLAEGKEGSAARIARDLAQWLKGDAGLHRRLADLSFAEKDYARSYPHLLRAYAYAPDEPDLALRLASVAARVGRKALAAEVLAGLLADPDLDAELRVKAEGLQRILAAKD